MVSGAPKGQVLRLVPREGKAPIAVGTVFGFLCTARSVALGPN
jgi:hypothetical protein